MRLVESADITIQTSHTLAEYLIPGGQASLVRDGCRL
jgi:hypothetical protein